MNINSYIPIESNHYPHWLKAIPKGQMIRVMRNCTDTEQFLIQSQKLIEDFKEKGYREDILKKTQEEIHKMERSTLLTYKKQTNDLGEDVPFILDYNVNNRGIKKSIEKHWPILRRDPIIGKILLEKP